MVRTKTALLSAFDKTGLSEFAQELKRLGFDLLGSRGTCGHLAKDGIPARDIAEFVGPPILGHRVVTLSREIHAGLLALDTPEDLAELDKLGMPLIDLVYVDLYPLEAEIKDPSHTLASVIEKTDIGGPTLLRSAAKGRRIVVSSREQFSFVLDVLRGAKGIPADDPGFISYLAALAEERVSEYADQSALFLHSRPEVSRFVDLILDP